MIGAGRPGSHRFIAGLGATPVGYGPGLPGRVRALGPVDRALDAVGAGSLPEPITIADFGGPRLGVRLSLGELGGQPDGRHGLATAAALSEERRFRVPLRAVLPLAQAAEAHDSPNEDHDGARSPFDCASCTSRTSCAAACIPYDTRRAGTRSATLCDRGGAPPSGPDYLRSRTQG